MSDIANTPGSPYGGIGNWNIGGGTGFPDPFMDMASTAMPTTIQHAMRWAQFIMMANGTYRSATDRVLSYFITDVQVSSPRRGDRIDDAEKDRYEDFFRDQLGISNLLHTVGLDYLCFHGDTRAVTREGVFRLRDLVGKTVDVLSEGGVYRPAAFKSFGRQRLLEVELSDGQKILATPEHQWVVKNCSGRRRIVPTTALRTGHRIPRVVAPRPPENDDYAEGVRHGFVFGDGTRYNDGKQAAAYFYGKKLAMAPYFAGSKCAVRQIKCGARVTLHRLNGLPAHYKELPANESSASYWLGFVRGFLAADGAVDPTGCPILTQASRSVLERIAEQLPRIGMVGGPIRGQLTVSQPPGAKQPREGYCYFLGIRKQSTLPEDLLMPHHRARFTQKFKKTRYGEYVGVRAVRETGVVDEVFCCVEPETHTFVIENAVLTGNCFGNSFTSVLLPFRRYLYCPKCFLTLPLREVYTRREFAFQWVNYEFHARCPVPSCGHHGRWSHVDRRGSDKDVRVKRWNPLEFELLWDPFNDDVDYIWKIPEDYKREIRKGSLFHLERANWEVVQAVRENKHLRFAKDVIFHLKEDALAGVYNRGWGIPRAITNFRQVWYVQVLHRYNEAIALDYVIPFRLITPLPQGSGGGGEVRDPLLNMNMGGFMSRVRGMLNEHRRDPAMWHTLPFPIQYQALGGDATQLAPRDLLDQGLDILLNNVGIPTEMYKGTLQLQAAPAALRLFESNWSHLVHNLNRFLRFLAERVSELLSWDPVVARLERVTHADDLNKQMAKLQLMMGQQISKTTGLKSIDVPYREEVERIMEEQRFEAEQAQKVQEEMERSQQGKQMAAPPAPGQPAPGQPAQGGQPAPAGGDPAAAGAAPVDPVEQALADMPMGPNQAITPQDLQGRAETLAQQLLGLPEGERQSSMTRLKQRNPALHAATKVTMENIRQRAQQQGGSMLIQQNFGGQG